MGRVYFDLCYNQFKRINGLSLKSPLFIVYSLLLVVVMVVVMMVVVVVVVMIVVVVTVVVVMVVARSQSPVP